VTSNNRFSLASQRRWEKRVMDRASRVVFTTPSAMRSYAKHYPVAARAGRMTVIPNGYDEAAFAQLPPPTPLQNRPVCMVHSGLLYPEGRNPQPFFMALANLVKGGELGEGDIKVVLRASGSEPAYAAEIRRLGLTRVVTLANPVSNQEALREQSRSDALLLFQGREFDHQIPAKVYEYLRVGRPILALVGAQGDAAALLRQSGGALLASIDSVPDIEKGLLQLVDSLRTGRRPVADPEIVRAYSRERGAKALADLLDGVS
jgi:glycosyltransferase involved in cell wall biosynthesis